MRKNRYAMPVRQLSAKNAKEQLSKAKKNINKVKEENKKKATKGTG